jgi:SAM-dependent methyltransferase
MDGFVKTRVRVMAQEAFALIFRWLARRGWLPLNRDFGRGRGLPVGRRYLERFLGRHAHRVRGVCLEFGDLRYRHHFRGAERYEVFSVVPGPEVDHLGDIHDPPDGLFGRYDWIVCTQVFQCVRRPDEAAAQLYRLLRPGGGLLFSVPFFNVVTPDPEDFRRFTADGVRVTLEDAGFVIEELESHGTFVTSVGALMGMASSDFPAEVWEQRDPQFPYTVTAVAFRPPSEPH